MAKFYFEKWSLKTVEVNVRAYDSKTDEHVFYRNTPFAKAIPNHETLMYDAGELEKPTQVTAPKCFLYPPQTSGGTHTELSMWVNTVTTSSVTGTIKKLDRTKDTLVENIVADENEFPANGIQGDYWYVRGEKAFPSLKLNGQTIGGAKIKDSVGQMRNVGNVYFKDSAGVVRNLK